MRQIVGAVREAKLCSSPFSKASRPRGAKAQGLHFEKALAAALGADAKRGQWFTFLDDEGWHYCQTDLLVEGQKSVLIIECKLTWVPQGPEQLELLYRPIVERTFGKPVLCLVASKRILKGLPRGVVVTSSLDEAVRAATERKNTLLHWIPGTPLRASLRRAA